VHNLFRRLLFHYWYYRQPPWDTGISPPELLEFIEEHKRSTPRSGSVDPPGRVIDIGCGTGTNVITLARAGWAVMGVDFAPRAIKIARQKVNDAGIQAELLVSDATRLEGIDGPFDLAFDLGCFHTIPQAGRLGYLKQLDRILAPHGFWLVYVFLRSAAIHTGPGLDEADLDRISSQLTLRSRRDGFDDHGERSSAWFLFQKM